MTWDDFINLETVYRNILQSSFSGLHAISYKVELQHAQYSSNTRYNKHKYMIGTKPIDL